MQSALRLVEADTRTRARLPVLVLAVFGVALEGYDNTLFGLFALPIGKAFFPVQSPSTSLLLAVAAFGVGYVARPLGGLVLGAYADRAGRPAATWGLIAPLAIVIARLVQGFAAGGAAAGGIAYLTEAATPSRRGLVSSWQQASQVGALLLTSLMGLGLSQLKGPAGTGSDYAWRLPFLLALFLGPVGALIQWCLPDTGPKSASAEVRREGIAQTLLTNHRTIAVGMGLAVLWTVSVFIFLFYMPTYAQHQLHMAASDAFLSSAVSSAELVCWCPILGSLSDRVGRKPVLLTSALAIAVGGPVLFMYLQTHSTLLGLLLVQSALAAPIGGYLGTMPATLAELYPTHARTTSIAVADNLVAIALGAGGPMIVLWLTGVLHSGLAPAVYVSCGAAISAFTVLLLTDRTGASLRL
jgi:MHS family proline/betaine transporter-like MFS transporter